MHTAQAVIALALAGFLDIVTGGLCDRRDVPTNITSSTNTTTSTTTTNKAPSVTVTDISKICASIFPNSPSPSKGCAKRLYSPSNGYKLFTLKGLTTEDSASLCLADNQCESFQWEQYSACANSCALVSTGVSNTEFDSGTGPYAWDRSCLWRMECPPRPLNFTQCINLARDTPREICQEYYGRVKDCVKPFVVQSMNPTCAPSEACRDLCAENPGCMSFSLSWNNGVAVCKLFLGIARLVADPDPSSGEMFTDWYCFWCGWENVAYFRYVAPRHDPVDVGMWACNTTAPTTPPTATVTCPAGVTSPGTCTYATPVPTGVIYESRGYAHSGSPYSWSRSIYPNQRDLADCALICKLDANCAAYGYDNYVEECTFLLTTLTASDFAVNRTSPIVWGDKECRDCVLCGPTVTHTPTTPSLTFNTTRTTTTFNTSATTYTRTTTIATTTNTGTVVPTYCPIAAPRLPDYVVCGVPATTHYEEDYLVSNSVPQPVGSLAECARICLLNGQCRSFSYVAGTTRCALLRVGVYEIDLEYVPSSVVRYYERDCFNCS